MRSRVGSTGDLEDTARRAWRRTAWIAAAGVVVGAIVGVAVGGLGSDADGTTRVLAVIGSALTVGGLGGVASLIAATLALTPAAQDPVRGLDPAGRRTIRRAVFSARPIEPPDSELAHRAVDWARGTSIALPIALGQFLLLYAVIAGTQLPSLLHGNDWYPGFARVFLVVILVVAVVMTAFMRHRIRNVRRYVATARHE
ncbi:hypothetical protein DEI99_006665 [Curtobacterium sp. MCLR17_036]|uniref:hypothetical protein n=1 Tax=Curtobacterium sp. MCLR17_036 TaxID=2175620 RepID=UPI000DAA4A87|nr:hypothetical protein [Curtobacterium sp. MCLR17_036]WIE66210.1 hypothetical protein DEI99_006665 [Curtobacterium sp. MCLR17_036]